MVFGFGGRVGWGCVIGQEEERRGDGKGWDEEWGEKITIDDDDDGNKRKRRNEGWIS